MVPGGIGYPGSSSSMLTQTQFAPILIGYMPVGHVGGGGSDEDCDAEDPDIIRLPVKESADALTALARQMKQRAKSVIVATFLTELIP